METIKIMETIKMGNDEFILYIRKNYENCKLKNPDLGRQIWEWILSEDQNAKQVEDDMNCLWETEDKASSIGPLKLPKTATQFEFKRSLLPKLYGELDRLGRIIN